MHREYTRREKGGDSIAVPPSVFPIVSLDYCGFAGCVANGTLPWRFAANALMNDLVWLPAFAAFALRHARRPA